MRNGICKKQFYSERDCCITADGLSEEWIRQIRVEHLEKPILVTASGLFYYFERETMGDCFGNLKTMETLRSCMRLSVYRE